MKIQWSVLREQGTRISHAAILDREQLGALYTVWYLSSDGQHESSYDQADDRPLTISQAFSSFDRLDSLRQQQVNRLSALDLGSSVLSVLCCEVPDGLLILDGNHRACALYASGVRELHILATIISGPLSRTALPDLQHWS
ncbi:hypothetical protein [Brachybacterium vulturis]|uniref:hypothetical protein n=1 Tax=Brachybacterium vulturis TaxID=2017484 RepID=UPI00373535B9